MAEHRLASIMLEMMNQQKNIIQVQINHLEEFLASEHATSSVTGSKPKKSKSEPKDPNQPKKYPTGYQIYITENQAKYREENPNITSREVMTQLGQIWRESSEETKASYQEKSLVLKAIYEEQMKEYSNSIISHGTADFDIGVTPSSSATIANVKSKKSKTSSSNVTTTAGASLNRSAPQKAVVEPSESVSTETVSVSKITTAAPKPAAKVSTSVPKPLAPTPAPAPAPAAPIIEAPKPSLTEESDEPETTEEKTEKHKKDKKKSKKHKREKQEETET